MTSAVLAVMAATPAMSSVSPGGSGETQDHTDSIGRRTRGKCRWEYSRLEWRIRHGAPGYKSGDPRPDFFTGEKPVVQITKAKWRVCGQAHEGDQTLLNKYASYRNRRLPYPSNGVCPSMRCTNDTFLGKRPARERSPTMEIDAQRRHGAIPFPHTENGNELIWNPRAGLGWRGHHLQLQYLHRDQTPAIRVTVSSKATIFSNTHTIEERVVEVVQRHGIRGTTNVTTAPPFKGGRSDHVFRDRTDYRERSAPSLAISYWTIVECAGPRPLRFDTAQSGGVRRI